MDDQTDGDLFGFLAWVWSVYFIALKPNIGSIEPLLFCLFEDKLTKPFYFYDDDDALKVFALYVWFNWLTQVFLVYC